MPVLIGTDEAGYGPNLGPLVITAVTWVVPEGVTPDQLPELLTQAITDRPGRNDERLHVADSKSVYQAGKSLESLERGVLAFLSSMGHQPDSLGTLGTLLRSPGFDAGYESLCRRTDVPDILLPVDTPSERLEAATEQLNIALTDAEITCERIESRIIFAEEFNQRTEAAQSKGVVLSEATLQLIRNAVDAVRDGERAREAETGWVICDKHGGRNRYDGLISDAFDDEFVFRVTEGRAKSVYRAAGLEFCFRTKAEEVMPVALASMVSKYVRELTMAQFNSWWKTQIPHLKPTKGYPVDALRFWGEIETKAGELGLDKQAIWRNR